ncbi:hypothetical protein V5735_08125 (plasmid) [Haladaptatus sp. SPP-AMP-3]|uniref:hypothetical protein n=1 Tax=Haladaptatus sp. SPP-AMP-3 TaxID=3121295 RepID=UPI003C2E7C17
MRAPTISAPTLGVGQRAIRWLGVLVLILHLGMVVALDFHVLGDPSLLVQTTLGTGGGLLLLLSTTDHTWNVEKRRLADVGFFCLSLSVLVSYLLRLSF